MFRRNSHRVVSCVAFCLLLTVTSSEAGELPSPLLDVVFPSGAQAGTTTELTLTGRNLTTIRNVHCNATGVQCHPTTDNRIQITIPENTIPGDYELWAECENGISSSRMFRIGNRKELMEKSANDSIGSAFPVPLNCVVNGQIESPGDQDCFAFSAVKGQRVIIEGTAERIDSRLRAVIELYDENGRRLAVNRGYFGSDPLIDFSVAEDGTYVVCIHDLISAGGGDYVYRLDIDAGPRVAFAFPCVVKQGTTAEVTLFGWNLRPPAGASAQLDSLEPASQPADSPLEKIVVSMTAPGEPQSEQTPGLKYPYQAVLDGFRWHLADSHAAILQSLTDLDVVTDETANRSADRAQLISVPIEVSGQLTESGECDWYAIEARRGEVFWLEAYGQRIQSPGDLQIAVLTENADRELAQFTDELEKRGDLILKTGHLDPSGRWIAPNDGRFLITVRSIGGGLPTDPGRCYRLSIRREDSSYRVIAMPRRDSAGRINVSAGGREVVDIVVMRERGFAEAIRLEAKNLPPGVECPEVWIGPGEERAALVVSADSGAEPRIGQLQVTAVSESGITCDVQGATALRFGTPQKSARLTSSIPLAVAGKNSLRITAVGDEAVQHQLYGRLQVKHSPGSIIDVAVQIESQDQQHRADVKLTATGLPGMLQNESAIIPAGQNKGYLSFHLPPTMPCGKWSLVIRAETAIPAADGKTEPVTLYSNAVNFHLQPAAFLVQADPFSPTRARRGETIQVSYSSVRRNGFIGKMHTELAAPGVVTDVPGIRGRGETFTGQTERGSLQIVINDDAVPGPNRFLRLFTVGVVEDEPVFFGSSPLPLEIIE